MELDVPRRRFIAPSSDHCESASHVNRGIGRAGSMSHDYKRHYTTTLFATLNVLTGTVIGECRARHRHEEFLKFLR
jgi:hypothetical protein